MSSDEGVRNNISNFGQNLAFTPNSAVISVPVTIAGNDPLGDAGSNTYFEYGETIIIESIFISVPYQWGLAEMGPLSLRFEWFDRLANHDALPIFDITGGINVPDVNISFPIDSVLDTPDLATDDWKIELVNVFGWNMNMLNSPAALDTIVQYPLVTMFVRSNFNMQA